MHPPIVYGLASVVPGLGHVLLGLPRRALNAIVLISMPGIAFLVVTRQSEKNLLLFLLVVAWIMQMIGAYLTAKEFFELSRETPITGKQTEAFRSTLGIKRTISQVMKTEETIDTAIDGIYMVERMPGITIQFPIGLRYLALTNKDLIVVDVNYIGKPSKIRRISRERITRTRIRKGVLSDQLLIEIDETADVNLRFGTYLREEAEIFIQLGPGWSKDYPING